MAKFDYISSSGIIVPDTSTVLEEVNAEWRSAFGQDLSVDPSTNQGVIISGDVELRDATMRNNAALANQINPDYAGGVFIDAIWSLTRGKRKAGTFSLLRNVVLAGQTGTIVPAGSSAAVTGTGAIFVTTVPVVIGGTTPGVATVDMVATVVGPVAVAPGALNIVATSVLGWETVSNPDAAEPGKLRESDTASRRRRRQTLALQSVSLSEAIISRLYNIPSVRSLQYRENYTDTDKTIDGIFLKKHSVWVCIDGGTGVEIATALLTSKTIGAGYNGSQVVSVKDPWSGQTYNVLYDIPQPVILFARITAKYNNTDAANIIPNAVMQYANGELEGDAGFVVGASVSPFELAGAVNQVEPRIFVTNVELSTDGATWSSSDLVLSLRQQAQITTSRIIVVAA